jgi:hypothetical protein
MIYCIWYPPGGFGHFINAVLSLHGQQFARPNELTLKFSSAGDSHALPLSAPKYFKDPDTYVFDFDQKLNYSVLIDNGAFNEGKKFLEIFPDSTVIKICYDDIFWPLVSRTMIDKAMESTIENELSPVQWGNHSNWAIREKYFLFFRDHGLRHAWKLDNNTKNLFVNDLLDYDVLNNRFNTFGIQCSNFEPLWTEWYKNNYKYFSPLLTCQQIIKNIKNNVYMNLSSITDIWTQAILYYYIWLEFNFEVPHNDYSNWFTTTNDIVIMLDKHGVSL